MVKMPYLTSFFLVYFVEYTQIISCLSSRTKDKILCEIKLFDP